ncbi:protocadherin-7-like isoform X1, partial [Clarias magur]
PFRRVTFSVVSQPQDPHQGSLQSCYDSGLDESETPSSKSSTGPRLGALPLPEDAYERTTPDGSVGDTVVAVELDAAVGFEKSTPEVTYKINSEVMLSYVYIKVNICISNFFRGVSFANEVVII